MQKIRITGCIFESRLRWQFKVEEKSLRTAIFRLRIYLRTNKTLTHLKIGNSLSNLGTRSAVAIYSMGLRLNLSTTPDLKF
jgi:hypothetical protein